jgi:hypothetical protein
MKTMAFDFFQMKLYYMEKVSMHVALNFVFDDGIYIEIFLSSHFSFYLHAKLNVITSKVHYESNIFFKFIHI